MKGKRSKFDGIMYILGVLGSWIALIVGVVSSDAALFSAGISFATLNEVMDMQKYPSIGNKERR